MTVILNYLDLKRSEIWLELEKELKAEGLKLVDSDQTGMECMLKICRNKIAVTVNTQRYLIQRHREQVIQICQNLAGFSKFYALYTNILG